MAGILVGTDGGVGILKGSEVGGVVQGKESTASGFLQNPHLRIEMWGTRHPASGFLQNAHLRIEMWGTRPRARKLMLLPTKSTHMGDSPLPSRGMASIDSIAGKDGAICLA